MTSSTTGSKKVHEKNWCEVMKVYAISFRTYIARCLYTVNNGTLNPLYSIVVWWFFDFWIDEKWTVFKVMHSDLHFQQSIVCIGNRAIEMKQRTGQSDLETHQKTLSLCLFYQQSKTSQTDKTAAAAAAAVLPKTVATQRALRSSHRV